MEYFTSITKQEDSSWLFSWNAAPGSTFEIWSKGTLLDTVDSGSYTCNITEFEGTYYENSPPPIEVVETGTVENETYPPFIILQWKGLPDAHYYRVDEVVGSVGTAKESSAEVGAEYYKYQSPSLEDDVLSEWEVTGLDEVGNGGTPVSLSKLIVRNPDPPAVEFAYSSTGDVTISEA